MEDLSAGYPDRASGYLNPRDGRQRSHARRVRRRRAPRALGGASGPRRRDRAAGLRRRPRRRHAHGRAERAAGEGRCSVQAAGVESARGEVAVAGARPDKAGSRDPRALARPGSARARAPAAGEGGRRAARRNGRSSRSGEPPGAAHLRAAHGGEAPARAGDPRRPRESAGRHACLQPAAPRRRAHRRASPGARALREEQARSPWARGPVGGVRRGPRAVARAPGHERQHHSPRHRRAWRRSPGSFSSASVRRAASAPTSRAFAETSRPAPTAWDWTAPTSTRLNAGRSAPPSGARARVRARRTSRERGKRRRDH